MSFCLKTDLYVFLRNANFLLMIISNKPKDVICSATEWKHHVSSNKKKVNKLNFDPQSVGNY